MSKEQPEYTHFECPACDFTYIVKTGWLAGDECPLCAGDTGYSVIMIQRTALDTDVVEGIDERKLIS